MAEDPRDTARRLSRRAEENRKSIEAVKNLKSAFDELEQNQKKIQLGQEWVDSIMNTDHVDLPYTGTDFAPPLVSAFDKLSDNSRNDERAELQKVNDIYLDDLANHIHAKIREARLHPPRVGDIKFSHDHSAYMYYDGTSWEILSDTNHTVAMDPFTDMGYFITKDHNDITYYLYDVATSGAPMWTKRIDNSIEFSTTEQAQVFLEQWLSHRKDLEILPVQK